MLRVDYGTFRLMNEEDQSEGFLTRIYLWFENFSIRQTFYIGGVLAIIGVIIVLKEIFKNKIKNLFNIKNNMYNGEIIMGFILLLTFSLYLILLLVIWLYLIIYQI